MNPSGHRVVFETHSKRSSRPIPVMVPSGHELHLVAPLSGAICPGGHLLHRMAPDFDENVPGWQEKQVLPVGCVLGFASPGGQGLQPPFLSGSFPLGHPQKELKRSGICPFVQRSHMV